MDFFRKKNRPTLEKKNCSIDPIALEFVLGKDKWLVFFRLFRARLAARHRGPFAKALAAQLLLVAGGVDAASAGLDLFVVGTCAPK